MGLQIEPEKTYVVCFKDGEYNYFEIKGEELINWLERQSSADIEYIFKKSDAVYQW